MVKQRVQEKRPSASAKDSSGNLMFVGVVCLAIGVGIGYYFGKYSSPAAAPVAAGQAQAPASNSTEFIQSEASLKATLMSDPKNVSALIQLGNLYYDHEKFADAVDYYGRALDIDPNNVDVRTDRGTSYWYLNKPDEAVAEFKKSLEVNPKHAQTLYNMGVVYLHGKFDEAEARKAWQQLLDTNPDYPERAKVQQQIAALSGSSGSTPSTPSGQKGAAPSGGVEDLFNRMQTDH